MTFQPQPNHKREVSPDIVFGITVDNAHAGNFMSSAQEVHIGGQVIPPYSDAWFWTATPWPDVFVIAIQSPPAQLPSPQLAPSVYWDDNGGDQGTTAVPDPSATFWRIIKITTNGEEAPMGFLQQAGDTTYKWFKTGTPTGQWDGQVLPTGGDVAAYRFESTSYAEVGDSPRFVGVPIAPQS